MSRTGAPEGGTGPMCQTWRTFGHRSREEFLATLNASSDGAAG